MNFLLIPLAFCCEFVDSALGMGYGTTLVPILLLLGWEPIQVVPAVLLSEFLTGLFSAFSHHRAENVNLHFRSNDFKVAGILSALSVVGVVVAVFVAISIPVATLKIWISSIILSMGVIILIGLHMTPRFAWWKIASLGTLAAFNKGMSGGGYGPLVMGGQILSGIKVKNAVGIVSFSESFTCLTGIVAYFIVSPMVDWTLAWWIAPGALLSVPIAVAVIKRLPEHKMKMLIGMFIICLGIWTLFKIIL